MNNLVNWKRREPSQLALKLVCHNSVIGGVDQPSQIDSGTSITQLSYLASQLRTLANNDGDNVFTHIVNEQSYDRLIAE